MTTKWWVLAVRRFYKGRLRNCKKQKGRNRGKNDWPNNCVREWSARKPCKISYLSFLSFRCDFARECFCEIRTWIVVYRELQKRQKQHLTPLVNYKCSIVWRKMSLSFINHLMIIFTRLVYLILFDRKNAPKLIFYRISKLKFYWVGRTYLVRFGRSLNLFCCNLARMLPDNRAQKRCRENFYFCVFQKLWPFLWRELLFYLSPKFKAVSRKN